MSEQPQKVYTVEYLCTLSSKDDFCTTISGFKSLLESFEKLKIEGNKILWGEKEFHIEIYDGSVLNSAEKYFHIKLKNDNSDNKIHFLELLKVIRTILSKVNNSQPPEILWDDISSEYAINSYPIIHELENLMRKLITKFMITKVGLTWTTESIPREVSDSLKLKKTNRKQNYIYETDFIQLSNFLFKDYATTNIDNFIEKIKKAEKAEDLDINELKKIIPVSNWERYFNPILTCTSDELVSKWDKLYKLRCKVAHNDFMDESDFNDLLRYSKSVREIIENAINNLDKVNVKEEDKEDLAESAVINLNKIYGDFILKWKKLENIIFSFDLYNSVNPTPRMYAFRDILNRLRINDYISEKDINIYDRLKAIRNMIIHDSSIALDEIDLISTLNYLEILEAKLLNVSNMMLEVNGWFEFRKNNNDKYYFVLNSANNECLLTSRNYDNEINVLKGIEETTLNGTDLNNYEILEDEDNKIYANLKDDKGDILGKTAFFSNHDSLTYTIESIQHNVRTNVIKDCSA